MSNTIILPKGTQILVILNGVHCFLKIDNVGTFFEWDTDHTAQCAWANTELNFETLQNNNFYLKEPLLNLNKYLTFKGYLEKVQVAGIFEDTYTVPKIKLAKDASELCLKASELLAERGKQYDGSGKERSMASTVAAFNAVYGTNLTEQQGWHFMILLKMVRQRAGGHIDSAEDLIAYAALAAENTHATLS